LLLPRNFIKQYILHQRKKALDKKKIAFFTRLEELYQPSARTLEDVNKHRSDIRSFFGHRVKRNGIKRPTKLWPHGRIPYTISSHYTRHERALLARAVKEYHDKTCIRFVPRTADEKDYLFIGKVDGCFSEVGKTSGVQILSLDNGCLEYATVIHEMMHVVGFYHEHERWDRDQYIDIIWQNIDKAALDQFGKVDLSKTSYYGQPYDYKSILHYDSLAFSKNGYPTMLPKQRGYASTIGNAKDFSEIDLAKINRMYGCPASNRLNAPSKFRVSVRLQKFQLFKELEEMKATTYHFRPQTYFYQNSDQRMICTIDTFKMNLRINTTNQPKDSDCITGCEDRITVCWWAQDRCHSPRLLAIMKVLCPKTCRFC
uniref:Metalloendopeptidase n=1 Tax=Syphacia muris TaxID=451379 RepID=A0A0N5AZI6_9BILA